MGRTELSICSAGAGSLGTTVSRVELAHGWWTGEHHFFRVKLSHRGCFGIALVWRNRLRCERVHAHAASGPALHTACAALTRRGLTAWELLTETWAREHAALGYLRYPVQRCQGGT